MENGEKKEEEESDGGGRVALQMKLQQCDAELNCLVLARAVRVRARTRARSLACMSVHPLVFVAVETTGTVD